MTWENDFLDEASHILIEPKPKPKKKRYVLVEVQDQMGYLKRHEDGTEYVSDSGTSFVPKDFKWREAKKFKEVRMHKNQDFR